jgi:hypothetical protein
MDIDNRIQIRAYFKWLERPNKNVSSEIDDWLAAESEEQAYNILDSVSEMTLPELSFNQDDIWFVADDITKLFGLLGKRLRNKREQNHLLSLINSYQDYLTSSTPVSDDEAARQGSNALHIFRLIVSLKVLVGNDIALTAKHTLEKELKDLFGRDRTAFDTAEFNIYTAAEIKRQSRLPVCFIGEGSETTPDLQVDDVAYIECKDIHTNSRSNIEKALEDNLAKAHEQLLAAQQRRRLLGTGVCIDVPWDTLPLTQPEWDVVRRTLSNNNAPQFVLISSSGISQEKEAVSFPVAVCLVWSDSGTPLFEKLLSRLSRVSYRMQPDGFDEVYH